MPESSENLAAPEEKWLSTSQLQMHYLDWGGAGTPIVALHGLASSAHWYSLTLPLLADTFHCIAPDQRAHGKTDQPTTGYDWATLANDIVEAMDVLGLEKAAILGHSWGASVAAHFAANHPDRITQLVLIDGGTALPRPAGATWEQFKDRLSPRDIYGPRERYIGALRRQFDHVWSDKLEQMVMSMVRINEDGTVDERLEPGNHAQVLRAMWDEPSSSVFPKIQAPTLLAPAGPRANANPDFAERKRLSVASALETIPNVHVEWIPETVHDIGFDKPAELATVLRNFLTPKA